MTARILLIRHAAHGQLGHVLSGRTPDLSLSSLGQSQAAALARRLAGEPIAHLHSSPVQRARETAAILARPHPNLPCQLAPALDEIDFGAWAGRAFADLAGDPAWAAWNDQRAEAATPGGETMAEAQDRAWAHAVRTALAHPGATIAMVSHCDIIRALIARVLDLSLNRLLSFEIEPASFSRIEIGEWGARVLSLNERADA